MTHGPANRRRRILRTAAPLFVVEPAGPVRGGAIVLHDAAGLTEDVEAYCRDLALDGRLAVAPFHYYETGGREYPDPAAAPELTTESLHEDATAALDYLVGRRGLGADQISAHGFGTGVHLARWTAAHHPIAAAVSVTPEPTTTPGRSPAEERS
ncbi:dienelactone hydrolase family protein [Pseudonocardia acaciae]|uniref:dienelactone hydrolase family protein n=1 Tax=Pseudonocardia acaciae TaxID=551276 RepID=UPI0006854631|nr:dienelactone hydrolase family protein [Pseudonocardia acaciae]